MPAVPAKTIKELIVGGVSDDGRHLVIQMVDRNDQSSAIAVPRDQLLKLIDWAAAGYAKSGRILRVPADDRAVFELKQWEFGELRDAPESGIVVISMTFGEEGTISYWLPRNMAQALVDGMQVQLKSAKPPVRRN